MATVPLQIEAEVTGLGGAEPAIVRGQAEVAVTKGDVQRVRLLPEAPPACPEVLEAIASASLLIFGPGSWFTSVLPHLLVPELAEAIHASSARRVVVLNLAPETETSGWGIADHLAALLRHEPRFRADVVIADEGVAARGERACWEEAAASVGGSLLVEPLAAGGGARHDPVALGRVLGRVLGP
jgi:uncharacterized cofD-like protein